VGKVDANENLLLGAPSGTHRVLNEVDLGFVEFRVYIPPGLTTNNFVRYYRTKMVEEALVESPGDEYFLVQEHQLTSAEISNGFVDIVDTYPEEILGEPLYTNATQDGILASNTTPPLSKDVIEFKGHTLYLNTANCQSIDMSMVALPAYGDIIQIGNRYYSPHTESVIGATLSRYVLVSTGDLAGDIEATVRNLVGAINAAATAGENIAAYATADFENPDVGAFRLTESTFYVRASVPADWYKIPAKKLWVQSVSRTGSTVTVTTFGSHGFTTADSIAINSMTGTPHGNFAFGNFTVTVTGATTFTYTQAGSAVTIDDTAQYTAYSAVSGAMDTMPMKTGALPNGVGISRVNQPEAVPYANFREVGSKGDSILRGAALKDAAFLFKEDGIWIVTGEGINSFRFESFDPTTRLIAPESVVVLGNAVYCLTNQGFVRITPDGGVTIISRNFEKNVLDLVAEAGMSSVTANCWALGYESDRKYIVTWPAAITSEATLTWVYNVLTNTWTKWVMPESFNTGLVSTANDKLYFTSANVARERKTRTHMDYADYNATITLTKTGSVFSVPLVAGVAVGDSLTQSGIARILTVTNGATSVITFENDPGMASGACVHYKAYEVEVEVTPFTGQDPGKVKQWQELEVFGGPTSRIGSFQVDITTENDDDPRQVEIPFVLSDQLAWEYPNNIRVDVPRNNQRSNQICVGISYKAALEEVPLYGIGILYRVISDRGGYG
jgi:hypothetical protein